MIKNYFVTALNYLLNNRLYALINILGLAIGLAAFLLISLYLRNELSYDRHWDNAERIYRVNQELDYIDERVSLAPTSLRLLPALQRFFPEAIETGSRLLKSTTEVQVGNTRWPGALHRVDADFIRMFGFEVLEGSLEGVFRDVNSIALSEESALRYFGRADALDEVLTFRLNNEVREYRVAAVYRLPEARTVLNMPNMALLDDSEYLVREGWLSISVETFVRLTEGTLADLVDDQLPAFVEQNVVLPPNTYPPEMTAVEVVEYRLQGMADIYFNPVPNPNPGSLTASGNKTMAAIFLAIAILVLLIGVANFLILSVARSTRRAREVALRKVAGARRSQLIRQFLGESLLFTALALFLALAMVEACLPFYQNLVDKNLGVHYDSPAVWLGLFALLIVTGTVGGLYPAVILSKYRPAETLKANQSTETAEASGLRGLLVIFQFSVSIILFIATAVVYGQLLYLGKSDPGFDPQNLLVLDNLNTRQIAPHRETLKQEILQIPGIISAGFSAIPASRQDGGQANVSIYRSRNETGPGREIPLIGIGYDFFQTYRMSLLAGRNFERGRDREERRLFLLSPEEREILAAQEPHIIINLSAVRQFGFSSAEDAVGQYLQGQAGPDAYVDSLIIGVVADSQFRSLRFEPRPEIFTLFPEVARYLSIRFEGESQAIRMAVEKVWREVAGEAIFTGNFVEQDLSRVFDRERNEGRLLIAFSLLSIFIACLGLYGMAAFTVSRRAKEIGLRKVMGAKIGNIVRLLLWQFSRPVLIAAFLACPIALWIMQNWLERFPSRFDGWLLIPICLAAGFIVLAIAGLTVAGNTARLARRKPTQTLRYE